MKNPRVLLLFLQIIANLILLGCNSRELDENNCRITLRRYLEANEADLPQLDAELLALPRYILMDIEHAYHQSSEKARRRLMLALEKLGHKEALPFLTHVATFDESDHVRSEAKRVANFLSVH